MWLLNVLPPAIIIWFCHSMSPAEILSSLGFGTGMGIAVIFLALLFLKKRNGAVILCNFVLLGFVVLSYYLPQLDNLGVKKGGAVLFIGLFMTPFLQSGIALVLMQYPLIVKPGKDSFEPDKPLFNLFSMPCLIGVNGSIILGMFLDPAGVARFSTVLIASYLLAWFIVWFALYVLGRPLQVDFEAVGNYVTRAIDEKRLKLRIRQDTIILAFLALLLVCTFFEAFRGEWRLWCLTALWLIFLFACIWRVWGFAFQPGEGPVWHYFDAIGNYLENIRTKMTQIEVKKESAFSDFLKSHTTSLSIILIIFLATLLIFFNINPILSFILLFGLAIVINYLIKETLKAQGIILEDMIPLSVGMIFIMTSIALFCFLNLLLFVIKQIIWG